MMAWQFISVIAGAVPASHDGTAKTQAADFRPLTFSQLKTSRMLGLKPGLTGDKSNAMPTYTWDHIHLRTADPEGMVQWF